MFIIIEKDPFSEAFTMWSDFKSKILYQNRFIIEHEVLDYIETIAKKCNRTIDSGTTLYRSRLYTQNDYFLNFLKSDFNPNPSKSEHINYYHELTRQDILKRQESGFWGYNEFDSFVPPNNETISDGRANPSYIKYLYTSETPYTSMVEVRPYLESLVSIAKIIVNEPLEIVDLSSESVSQYEGFEQYLIYLITSDFSRPSNSNNKSYIPTQYIAEFIKTLGFDGIRFNSSLHKSGRNLTIFTYEKCKVESSRLYKVEDICFETKNVAPNDGERLIHEKLEPYRNVQKSKLIDALINLKKTQN